MLKYIIILFLFFTTNAAAQYKGGSNDGFLQLAVTNQNTLPNIYAGGSNDGYHQTAIINQNTLPNIYSGGSNDGFHQITIINQNTLPNIYTGSSNDGFASKIVFGQNSFCTGDIATWNGSVSIAWENPANWDCGTLPGISSNVIIPSGLTRYPTVSFTYEIKSLYLQPGSSVTVLPAVNFKLNGN
jgi:hypothetical protein